MNLQENIRRILKEVRVPRSERVELYKDDNIIVVVPLTHRALQKYAHRCQWCINDDKSEWEDYHQGMHAVIIQRNPKKPKIGITGNPTASEILIISRWREGGYNFKDVGDILGYDFKDYIELSNYEVEITNNIDNFATNIVYYSPENGLYDMEDNYLWNFDIEINDIPNVTPKAIEIIHDYLEKNEETQIQENIRRILREDTKLPNYIRRRIDFETIEQLYQFILKMCSQRYKDNKKNRDAITPYHFQQKVISNLVWEVCENYELECEDGGDNYKQMWDFLSNMYSKRTIKHFYEIR